MHGFLLFAGHHSVRLLCPADYAKTFGLPCINPQKHFTNRSGKIILTAYGCFKTG